MARFIGIISVCSLLLAAVPAAAEWQAESAALGARDHPKVLQRFGGEIRNEALSDYVSEIGATMVAVSERPSERWTFTVLDSAEVNAFALPAGYIYVTRGLLALANNEAELAAVLAHEITHVTQAHVEQRQEANKDALVSGALNALVTGLFNGGEDRINNAVRSGVETAFGQMGAYSKEQEFAADAGGIDLLREAGYRPAAQADFLASMAANAALKAKIAGRAYDEATAPEFANHPAPAERQLRALALAQDVAGVEDSAEYLNMIEGMVYGQSARAGFVNGQVFTHPVLGFSFTAAQGLRIQNQARTINIYGPNRSVLIMSGAPSQDSLSQYLNTWFAQIPRRERQSRRLQNLRQIEINGLEAATGTLQIRKRGKRSTLRLTVIRFDGELIRFAGTVRRGDEESAVLQWETVESFSALANVSVREQLSLVLYRVKRRDTVESLAAQMGVSTNRAAWFRVLNGLGPEDTLTSGELVKLVQ